MILVININIYCMTYMIIVNELILDINKLQDCTGEKTEIIICIYKIITINFFKFYICKNMIFISITNVICEHLLSIQ